jgi:hypothetical protein
MWANEHVTSCGRQLNFISLTRPTFREYPHERKALSVSCDCDSTFIETMNPISSMKRKLFINFILLLIGLFSRGQSLNNVYIEFGGNTVYSSVNYERIKLKITSNSEGGQSIRFGSGFSPRYDTTGGIKRESGLVTSFIVGYSMFLNYSHTGTSTNFFELGGNLVYAAKGHVINKIWDLNFKDRIYPSLNIGYRHQPIDPNNIFWKIDYCPSYISSGVKHWLGTSVGYSF